MLLGRDRGILYPGNYTFPNTPPLRIRMEKLVGLLGSEVRFGEREV